MISPWFAKVHERTCTPVNATTTMLAATAIIVFFTSLGILSNLLSISTLFIFMLVTIGLIVRRYYVSATTVYWGSSDGWIGLVVSNSIWFLSTLALWLGVPQAKKPRVWGVPLVLWLPSLSVAINLFLLGSINKASFERFGIWIGILLIYYILIGLHASYDSDMESKTTAG
ncbi:Cationic amino acid transporter 1, partial [Cucurbita argyrosperma subsp. sororia]